MITRKYGYVKTFSEIADFFLDSAEGFPYTVGKTQLAEGVMIGDKLKELLELRNMKQAELARRIGVSATTINSVIKRNSKSMDFSVMEKIADVLGVPIEYFRESNVTVKEELAPETIAEPEREDIAAIFTYLSDENQKRLLDFAQVLLVAQQAERDTLE